MVAVRVDLTKRLMTRRTFSTAREENCKSRDASFENAHRGRDAKHDNFVKKRFFPNSWDLTEVRRHNNNAEVAPQRRRRVKNQKTPRLTHKLHPLSNPGKNSEIHQEVVSQRNQTQYFSHDTRTP